MVSIFTTIINIKRHHISLNKQIETNLKSFKASNDNRCRFCGKKKMKYFGRYSRVITDIVDGKIEDVVLNSERYICDCGKTHVVLPTLAIPYCRYSLTFIITVLYAYFKHSSGVEELCNKYKIGVPTLYRWIALFKKDKRIWLGYLKDLENDDISFLKALIDLDDISIVLKEFMSSVYPFRFFLQNHKNAYYHQYV